MRASLLTSVSFPPTVKMEARVLSYAELWLGNALLDRAPIAEDGRCYFNNVPIGSKFRVSVTGAYRYTASE